MSRVFRNLESVNPWHFLWITVILAELFTAVLNAIQSHLRWGFISYELMTIGAIDALFVPAIVAPIIIIFVMQITKLREDIGRQQEFEKALRESEKKYKDLVELLPQFVFETDDKGAFNFLNRYSLENMGYTEDDFNMGLNALQMFIPEELVRAGENIQKILSGELIDRVEFTLQRKDGTAFPVLISASPIVHENKITGIRGIAIDITERKRLEQEQQKFVALIENSSDFIGIASLDGRVLHINGAGRELVGLESDDEARTKMIFDFFFEEDLHELEEAMLPAGFWQGEFRLKHYKTGLEIPVDFTGFLIRDLKTCQPLAHATITRDITERKLAELAIRKLNEELECKVEERTKQLLEAQEELVRKEKLATLGQLSGSVGHELRNPLGVMSNAVYYLKTVMSGADETVKEYLNIIKSEIDNSQRIISDLLDFSRVKTPQSEVIMVDKVVRQSLGKCAVPANVTLRLEMPDTLPAVNVDPLHMEQVFQNLVTNAIQAMPDGGELSIRGRLLWAALRGCPEKGDHTGSPLPNENDFVEISVSDTGEGISSENMKKLFQPLFTTKARGIGLGLIVSKNLVEANGGRIKVESESGKGTTFTVILPLEMNGKT